MRVQGKSTVTEYQETFQKFKRDVDYYEARREELLKRYPERWIAIRDGEVIVAASSPEEIRDYITEKGLPRDRVLVRHLTTKEDLLVL